jgi:spore maturation protein CgeB
MPLGFYPDQYFKSISVNKKYDITFMGASLTKVSLINDLRVKYLQSLRKFNIVVFGETFKNKLKNIRIIPYKGHTIERIVYGSSKINLDLPFVNYNHIFYKEQIHFKNRFFEIPATGNFLLTCRCPEFMEIFPEDVVGYYDFNIESLKENIKKYLRDEKNRKTMAKKAYNIVYQKHTFLHRFKEMFNIIYKKV